MLDKIESSIKSIKSELSKIKVQHESKNKLQMYGANKHFGIDGLCTICISRDCANCTHTKQ